MAILAAIVGLYLLQAIIFNEIHLRRKKEHVSWAIIIGYYVSSPLLSFFGMLDLIA